MLLPPQWNLPETITSRIGERIGRQRAMFAQSHLLLLLHKPPLADSNERQAALFWRSPEGDWQSTARGGGINALRRHLEEYDVVVDTLEEECQSAESAADYFDVLKRIAPLQRAAQNLHLTLQTARESVPHDRDLIVLRDRAYEIARAAELTHTDARHGLEFAMAQQAEQQAQSSEQFAKAGHRLNLLAGIFLPMTAIGGIFGMNLASGVEEQPGLFWLVFLLGLMMGAGLFFLLNAGTRSTGLLTKPDRWTRWREDEGTGQEEQGAEKTQSLV